MCGISASGRTDSRIHSCSARADALLTQRALADYLIAHDAHYVFTVKDNQPTLHADIRLFFAGRGQPDFRESPTLAHGRIEQRAIWTTARLNNYLDFPGVGHAFVIERHTVEKKTGKTTTETIYGVTSHTRDTADAARVLAFNRGHWTVYNGCHYTLDWNWDEDRCTIRNSHRPRPRECHRAAPLRHRRHQGEVPRHRRRDHPTAGAQRPPRVRLSAHDRELPPPPTLPPSTSGLNGLAVGAQAPPLVFPPCRFTAISRSGNAPAPPSLTPRH